MNNYGQLISLRRRFSIEFDDLVKYKCNSLSVKGLFDKLMRSAPSDAKTNPEAFLSWFVDLTILDLIDIQNLGPKGVRNALDIQKMIRYSPSLREKLLDGCTELVLREEM